MDASYQTCWTIDDWVSALRRSELSPFRGMDFEGRPDSQRIETTSALRHEDGAEVVGIGIAWVENGDIRSAYVGFRHDRRYAGGKMPDAKACLKALSDSIERMPPGPGHGIIIANLAMELPALLAEGCVWPAPGQVHDTQVAARVLNKGVGFQELIGLGPLQVQYLKRDQASSKLLDQWLKEHRFKPGQDIWRAPVPLVSWYCQDDARDCLALMVGDKSVGHVGWMEEVHQPVSEWWWNRAPNKSTRQDLYEMEIEAAIQAIIACLRGMRIDLPVAKRKAAAARALQLATTRWVRDELKMPTLNPGSQDQLRGILFGPMGFEPSLAHLTESFTKKMTERDQAKVLAGVGPKPITDYASLDVEALDYYAEKYPEHAELMFMLAVYRKCNTAITWFENNVTEFGATPWPDPWWDRQTTQLANLIFHRLRTIGARSGRMTSSDYNGQQVPKRFKMLIDAEALKEALQAYLPSVQFDELWEMLDFAACSPGDESKVLGLMPGSLVLDFSIKGMFIPRDGDDLRNWDLSQVEMRGFAHFSGNRLLCDGYGRPMTDDEVNRELQAALFFAEHGYLPDWCDQQRHVKLEANPFDIHKFVSSEIGVDRKAAKGINFGIVYGMGKKKLGRELGWGPDESKLYLGKYHAKFSEIEQLQNQIKSVLRRRGYIFDPYGRRYYLPINRAYVGLNRLIQGWAASVFKVGFIRSCHIFASPGMGGAGIHPLTRRHMPGEARMVTCIHDESMGEVKHSRNTFDLDWAVRTSMVAHHGLNVPLGTSSEESSTSWDQAVPFIRRAPEARAA